MSTIDVTSGEIFYESAYSVRADSCGREGQFYQPAPQLQWSHDQPRVYLGYIILYISTLILLS